MLSFQENFFQYRTKHLSRNTSVNFIKRDAVLLGCEFIDLNIKYNKSRGINTHGFLVSLLFFESLYGSLKKSASLTDSFVVRTIDG